MKRLITTPIFYPNAKPHIGHAYTCVITDFLTRYYKSKGDDVIFSTGLDEHGQKIAKTAAKKGITEQNHVDEMAIIFQDLMEKYQIDYTTFIRTTSLKHEKAVQFFWNKLAKNGFIYLSKYKGWYDISDENFIKEEEIDKQSISQTVGNKQARTIAGKSVVWIEEDCHYFKLSEFTQILIDHYQKHSHSIVPTSRLNEVIGFLKQGLNDIAISRTSVKWGIKVPKHSTKQFAHNALQKCTEYIKNLLSNALYNMFDVKQFTIYVWIDALVNYLTVLDYPNLQEEYWNNSIHIIGKDILKFHAIYWPSFLKAANIAQPKQILTHGWWLVDEDKMSKSVGNVVDPIKLLENYSAEQIRWFFMRNMTFGNDASFNFDQLDKRCNELSNTIGNLVQRSTSLLLKKHKGETVAAENFIVQKTHEYIQNANKAVEEHKFHLYADAIYNLAIYSNKYLDQTEPWKSNNSQQILSNIMHSIKSIAILLQPIMPNISKKILASIEKRIITPIPILFPKQNNDK